MKHDANRLQSLASTLLHERGAPLPQAALQAELLVEAEMRGLPSHGLQRLPRLLARIDAGLADPRTQGVGRSVRPAFLAVDGQRGLGPVVLDAAIGDLLPKARRLGMAMAAIRNANHIGMLAWYVERIAQRGMIGIVMTTSEALVHPFGGTEAMLGTNPIAIGVPTADEPFVLDLATSLVSMGKIHHHASLNKPIPEGWAVDKDGHPTTDPHAAKGGALAPFGDAKGYGLGLAVELLVAALAGSSFAPEVRGTLDEDAVATKGDVVMVIDPTAGGGSVDAAGPSAALTTYLNRLRQSRPRDPTRPVSVPGDGMRARRDASQLDGIELPDTLYETLLGLARP